MYTKFIFLSCIIAVANAKLIVREFIFNVTESESNSTESCANDNEEFYNCGSSCEPSCDKPSISSCTYECVIDVCQCAAGYFRNANGDCVMASECGEPKTACHKDLFEAFSEGPPPPGRMVVSCNDDGLYETMQCHGSTGYCWCVDEETGEEISGTSKGPTEGPVPCAPLTDCQKEASAATNDDPPAPGQSVVQCSDDGNYESMQCHGSTGECWCVNVYSGEEIDGTRSTPLDGPPDCYAPAPNLAADPSQFNCTDTEEFLECGDPCEPSCENPSPSECGGSCTPACACKSGYFRHSSAACVDATECEAKGPCHEEIFTLAPTLASGIIGAFVPTCTSEGTFSSMQCHGSTGYCWCVDEGTGEEINGTRKGPTEGPVPCAPLTDCQKENAGATNDGPPPPGQMVVQCSDDGNYESMQCHGSTGECWCVDIYSGEEINGTRTTPKDGPPECSAPDDLYPSAPNLTADPSQFNCTDNEEFLECGNPCELSCENPSPFECGGSCYPSCACKPGYFRHSSGGCVDGATCKAVGPCHEEVFALAPSLAEGIAGAFVPRCSPEGTYWHTQCHGSTGQCWCVNTSNGTEISGTRSGPGEDEVPCTE